MSAEKSPKDSDVVPTLGVFEGQHKFQAWKLNVQTTSMTSKFEWLPKGGLIVHNKIQKEVHPSIAPPAPRGNIILKVLFSDYSDAFWNAEMERTNFSIIMKDVRLSCLKREMGFSTWDSRSSTVECDGCGE
jgi:hypothetical protein